MSVTGPDPTSLYRYYDDFGTLIYVGVTKRGVRRNHEHFSKEWWQFVASQTVTHFEDRPLALAAEKDLIADALPPFNKQHNTRHAQLRSAYLAVAAASEAAAQPLRIRPVDLYRELGKRLPLRVAGNLSAKRIALVTDPQHVAIARLLVMDRRPGVSKIPLHSGSRLGYLSGLEHLSGVTRIIVHRKAEVPSGAAIWAHLRCVSGSPDPLFYITKLHCEAATAEVTA